MKNKFRKIVGMFTMLIVFLMGSMILHAEGTLRISGVPKSMNIGDTFTITVSTPEGTALMSISYDASLLEYTGSSEGADCLGGAGNRTVNPIDGKATLSFKAIAGGSGDSRFSLDRENIGGSGYSLGQICGFLIFATEKVMFASQWDEKEIRRELFVLPEEVKRVEEIKPARELQSEEEIKPERELQSVEEIKPERELQREEEIESERKTEEIAQETELPKEIKQSEDVPGQTNEQLIFGDTIRATEAAAQSAEQPWAMKWKFMLENYPVMTPFEGDEGILCIRMELKDLRLLPKRYWYLGNNSFLLHGFFNYRYIILGAMQEKKQKRWFLGVPGVFQSQEKVMAAIFGFPEYKSEKVSEQKTGQFGYWYRFLE